MAWATGVNFTTMAETFSSSGRRDLLHGSLSLKITSPRGNQAEN